MTFFKSIFAASLVAYAAAECPNACSGHGKCSQFDMCTCFRNWQSNDCSQRTCPFDLAHVDTPKGDLDHSNSVTHASAVISSSTVYPYGTVEMFPDTKDSAGNALTHTAHAYMECSNKGICDRTTGNCECFDGYDGTACQRASCPNDCSGHGTCNTISEIAAKDNSNVYALWDKDATMGCTCDAGYSVADCSERSCPSGVDPLYADDNTVINQSDTIQIKDTVQLGGSYALKLWDTYGEDWISPPIPWDSDCTIINMYLALSPNAGGKGYTCSGFTVNTANQDYSYVIFSASSGTRKSPEIVTHLDGKRSSLTGTSVTTSVTPVSNGMSTDYFPTLCAGTGSIFPYYSVNIASGAADGATWGTGSSEDAAPEPGSVGYLGGTTSEINLLKACLGDSDGDASNNVEIFNWDHGAVAANPVAANTQYYVGSHPHAVRMSLGQDNDYFGLVWWDAGRAAGYEMRSVGMGVAHASVTATKAVGNFKIYTTTGVVQQLAMDNNISTDTDDKLTNFKNETKLAGYFSKGSNKIYTNFDGSCNAAGAHFSRLHNCVEKGDLLFVVDGCWGASGKPGEPFGGTAIGCAAPSNHASASKAANLVKVTKVYTKDWTGNTTAFDGDNTNGAKGQEDRFVIEVDHNLNWDGSAIGNPDHSKATNRAWGAGFTGTVVLFKFTPATDGSAYTYFSECSNRGSCDRETGLCSCFKGYTKDNCSEQNALAV